MTDCNTSIGTPEENPRSQLRSTTYLRIFAEAPRPDLISTLPKVVGEYAMQQFSGLSPPLPSIPITH